MRPSGRHWLLSTQLGIKGWSSPFCCHFLPLSCLLSPSSSLCRLEPPSPQQLPRSLNHRRAFVPSGPVGLAPGAPPGPALCRLLSLLSRGVFTGTFPCPPLFSLPALPLPPLLSFICHLCRRPRSPQGAHRKLPGKFSKLVALTPWRSMRTSHLFVLFFQFISERAIV